MDRIRRALDLARQGSDRAFTADRQAPTIDPEAKVRMTGEPPRSAPGLPAKITYTNTRVFAPDAVALESKRIINPASTDAAASAFRMLRTQVIQRMDENGWRTL